MYMGIHGSICRGWQVQKGLSIRRKRPPSHGEKGPHKERKNAPHGEKGEKKALPPPPPYMKKKPLASLPLWAPMYMYLNWYFDHQVY